MMTSVLHPAKIVPNAGRRALRQGARTSVNSLYEACSVESQQRTTVYDQEESDHRTP
jgi:hypothetical protein